MSHTMKCSQCGNMTTNPLGVCDLHDEKGSMRANLKKVQQLQAVPISMANSDPVGSPSDRDMTEQDAAHLLDGFAQGHEAASSIDPESYRIVELPEASNGARYQGRAVAQEAFVNGEEWFNQNDEIVIDLTRQEPYRPDSPDLLDTHRLQGDLERVLAQDQLYVFRKSELGQKCYPQSIRVERSSGHDDDTQFHGVAVVQYSFTYQGDQFRTHDRIVVDLETHEFQRA